MVTTAPATLAPGDYGNGQIRCSPSAPLLAWTGRSMEGVSLQVWNYETCECLWSSTIDPVVGLGAALPVSPPVAFAPDGATVAIGYRRWLKLFRTETGELLMVRPAVRRYVTSLNYLPDGDGLLATSIDGCATLWDAAGVEPVWRVPSVSLDSFIMKTP
jgi:WD40 repeat protein